MLPKPKISPIMHLSDHVHFLMLNGMNRLFEPSLMPSAPIIPRIQNPSSSHGIRLVIPVIFADSEPFKCELCPSGFKTKQGLNKHIGKVHHEKEKTEECPECGKKFMHKHAVRFHITQVHEKATRIQCEECGHVLYNKYELNKHMRKHHYSVVQASEDS